MISKCNSCGATYEPSQSNNSRYFHACSPDVITPAICNAKTGEVVTPEKRTPRAVIRDENLTTKKIDGVAQIASEGDGITVLPEEGEAL